MEGKRAFHPGVWLSLSLEESVNSDIPNKIHQEDSLYVHNIHFMDNLNKNIKIAIKHALSLCKYCTWV